MALHRRLRHRPPGVRRRERHVAGGWRAPTSRARYRARRIAARHARLRTARGRRPLPGAPLAPARKRLLVLRPRLAVSGGGRRRQGRHRNHGPRARERSRETAPRARAAFRRPGVRLPRVDHLAQSQPDPRDGAPRHPGPLQGLVRRIVLDGPQSPAVDAHLFFRVRRGHPRPVAHKIRIRALLPGRDAALAGLQRGSRPRARCYPGTSQFREEAGFRGGNAPREPGGFGTRHGTVCRGSLLRVSVGHPPPHPAGHPLVAVAHRSPDFVHRGSELVSGRPGRICARPGPDHRVCADGLVLHDADLLSGEAIAGPRSAADHEPDVRAGACLSRHPAGQPRPGVGRVVEVFGSGYPGVRAGPRLVL